MNFFFTTTLMLCCLWVYGQSAFNKVYDRSFLYNSAIAIVPTTDNGFVAIGKAGNPFEGIDSVYLFKTDANGYLLWEKTYELSTNSEYAEAIIQSSDGGFIVCGTINNEDAKGKAYLLKVDTEGNFQWMKEYGGTETEIGREVITTSDGGYALIGQTRSYTTTNNGASDAYVVKTDSLGNIEWEGNYGTFEINSGRAIRQTQDGHYILCGSNSRNSGLDNDGFIVKIDSVGNLVWQNNYMTIGDGNYLEDIIETSDGNYLAVGGRSPGLSWDKQGYMVKTDTAGTIIWEKNIQNSNCYEGFNAVVELSDGGLILSGNARIDVPTCSLTFPKGWLVRTDEVGDTLWTKIFRHYEEEYDHYFRDVQVANDGGFIICGSTLTGGLLTKNDTWIVKTDSLGNDWVPVHIELDAFGACTDVPYNIFPAVYGGSTAYVSYNWSGTATPFLNQTDISNPIFTPTTTGDYTLNYTVTDTEGSTATESIDITITESPTAAFFSENLSTSLGNSLFINPLPSGGTLPYTHHWTGNGVPYLITDTLAGTSFIATETGVFDLTYTVLDAHGCIATDDIVIMVSDTVVGIEELTVLHTLQVYPNPITTQTKIQFPPIPPLQKASLHCYDLLGRQVATFPLSVGQQQVSVGTSRWESGIYFVVLEINGRVVGKEKMVVLE